MFINCKSFPFITSNINYNLTGVSKIDGSILQANKWNLSNNGIILGNSGNLGIGTTNPEVLVDIRGDGRLIVPFGKIGIGTTNITSNQGTLLQLNNPHNLNIVFDSVNLTISD